jgi:hypothetical protein
MTMTLTNRSLVDRMVALGIMSAERGAEVVRETPSWINLDGDLEPEDIADMLHAFGLAVHVHCEDVDDLEGSYRHILEQAAALSGGSVVVTDVALDMTGALGKPLTFKINGEPRAWHEEHRAEDYLDAMAVVEQIGELAPGGDDPRHFFGILGEETGEDDYYLLLTDEQAAVLRDELGLELDEV